LPRLSGRLRSAADGVLVECGVVDAWRRAVDEREQWQQRTTVRWWIREWRGQRRRNEESGWQERVVKSADCRSHCNRGDERCASL